MFDESIPLTFNKKGTRENVISTLSKTWPLSAKEIHILIQKEATSNISYQAVHKALIEMLDARLIEKRGRKYALNIKWIDKSIESLAKIKNEYSKKVNTFSNNIDSLELQKHKFTSVSDLSVSLAELISSNLLTTNKNTTLIGVFQFGWFSLKSIFRDILSFLKIGKANLKSIAIIQTETPFGRWICKQYEKANICCAPIGTQTGIMDDIIIQGDYIIEIKLSDESKLAIKHLYNKLFDLDRLLQELGIKSEPDIDATVTITKNPSLAAFMRKELERIYEEAITKEALEKKK